MEGASTSRFNSVPSVSKIAGELADREAIRDCLYRYSRGIDRCDRTILRSAYWPDATDSHGVPGRPPRPAYDFIDSALPFLQRMDQTVHMLGNILMRIEGDSASVEAYYQAFYRILGDAGPRDVFVAGRYFDRMEKRSDEWRIAKRFVVVDWFRSLKDSADWSTGPLGGTPEKGLRLPEDASYKFFEA